MARRRTIDDNPLDALIPRPPADDRAEGPAAARQAPAVEAKRESDQAPAGEEAPAAGKPRAVPGEEVPATKQPGASALPQAVPEQVLTFFLAGEEYAAGILRIREIVEYETLTRVPMTPPWIRGVMNLRGAVVPVVDLAVKFGLRETAVSTRPGIVIVEVELEEELSLLGMRIDAVGRVLDLAPESVEKPPAFGTRVRVDFLLGVAKVAEELVLLLDLDRVLSTDELLAASAASASASAQGEPLPDTAALNEPPAEPGEGEDPGSAGPGGNSPDPEANAS